MPTRSRSASTSKRLRIPERSLQIRFGEFILIFLFFTMLAGRFTLDRIFKQASGIDLRYLLLAFGAFALIVWLLSGFKDFPPKVPMVGGFALLYWGAGMMLSAMWAPFGAEVAKEIKDFLFLVIFVLMTWLVASLLPLDSLDRVWQWLFVVGLVYFVLALIAGPDAQGRYAALGGGPNTFVRIMVAAAISSLYLAVVKKYNVILFAIPIFAVGAVLSGSRGGLLAAAVLLVLFFVPIIKKLQVKRTLALLFAAGIMAVPAFRWNDGYLWRFVEDRFIKRTFQEGYTSGRDVIADQAFQMYLNNPIFGVGLGGFAELQEGISVEYAHNLVLSVLAEAGTVGGILLATLLFRLIFATKGFGNDARVLFPLLTGLYFFATSMFSGDYYDSRFVWFFLGIAAISSARLRIDRKDDSPKHVDSSHIVVRA